MGLLGSLFGGKKKQTTSNGAYDQLNTAFKPMIGQGVQASGQVGALLGLGGAPAQGDALDNWWKSSGGQFMLDQGLNSVGSNFFSRGLGQSGAAAKAMENYRSGLASTKLNEYLGNLFNLGQQGLGAGQVIAGAAPQTTKQSGGGGLGKALGFGLSLLSDPRLKTDVVKLGEAPDGLGVYRYRYRGDQRQRVGVMADEVALLRPWALGPTIGGYASVRYDLLEAA